MDTDADKQLLDHGWRHFEFHAQQRLSLFNFYIVLCGLLAAAWATVITSDQPIFEVGFFLSAMVTLFSYVFWRMDQRNAHLTKRSERLMGKAEERLFKSGECLFCAEEIDKPLGKIRHLRTGQWSHGTSLRVIFIFVGFFGMTGAAYSAISYFEEPRMAVTN